MSLAIEIDFHFLILYRLVHFYGIETNDSMSASVVQLAIIIMTHYKRKEVINNLPEIARMLV